MQLYKYNNYEQYKIAQITANKKKLNSVWVQKEDIEYVANYIKNKMPSANFGICHGVRNGWEVEKLRDLLKINVVGTDIADTAVSNVIPWDFHDEKKGWVGNVCFVYSNSLDHSYKPKDCLSVWMASLRPGGRCFIHHSRGHNVDSNATDPFQASLKEYTKMITNDYDIEHVERIKSSVRVSSIIVIKNR